MGFLVNVVQFLHPNGRQKEVTTTLMHVPESLYRQMTDQGCHFEAEILRTDEVSLTISNKDGDLDIEIVPNGPEVQEGLEKMLLRRFWEKEEDEPCPAGK